MKVLFMAIQIEDGNISEPVNQTLEEVISLHSQMGNRANCRGVTKSGYDFDFQIDEVKSATLSELTG